MKEIDAYKIAWNTAGHEGIFLLHIKGGGVEQVLVDDAEEGKLMLDTLRDEKPVFYNNGLLFTGFEAVGEGEVPSVEKSKLRLIEGIGPKIEGILHEGGILSFQQLADAEQSILKGILKAAGSRYSMHDPGTWGQQAALIVAGKMDELKKWQDELDGGRVKK